MSSESQWNNEVEPASAGREAFWLGRPVWANPFIGIAARAWKTGWVDGQAEFAIAAGEPAMTASGPELDRLLEAHRPADVTAPFGQFATSRSRTRRRQSEQAPTYTVAVPRTEMASGF